MREGNATAPGPAPSPTAVDVLILGAGINGAALARELLLDGASVVVVDTDDIASGTTRWSTRLVHGGLRYLEYGEFNLVRESLAERDRLCRLAPHLVVPLGFCVPLGRRLGGLLAAAARIVGWEWGARRLAGGMGRGSLAVGCGLWLYDLLSPRGWPRHRMTAAAEVGLPRVDRTRFPLAALYTDAQMRFPERFTVELLVDARRIARERGLPFEVLTRHAARFDASGVEGAGVGPDGRVVVAPLDGRSGEAPWHLAPRAIVNATGAWVDRTNGRLLPSAAAAPLIGGTKGSHLIVDDPRLRAALGDRGVYAEAPDGRPVFVLPFGPRLVLVGTTDIPFAGDPALARADDGEIEYLLAAVARLFPDVAPGRMRVLQHYCGVRPLPARRGDGRSPAGVTRRHMLLPMPQAPVPMWSIVGGKLTTCRSLAETAAAEVLAALGMRATASSRDRPLPGACDAASASALVTRLSGRLVAAGLTVEVAARGATETVALFGARAADVIEAAVAAPRDGGVPLLGATGLPAEVVGFCLAEEWGGTLDDLVERRLMLAFDPDLTTGTLRAVAAEMVRCGRLEADGVEAEVAGMREALQRRYGKRVGDGG